jgi:membrane protease YdiL (CAAX protease family)
MALILSAVIYVAVLVYQANLAERDRRYDDVRLQLALYVPAMGGIFLAALVLMAAASAEALREQSGQMVDSGGAAIDLIAAFAYFGFTCLLSGFSAVMVRYPAVRLWFSERLRWIAPQHRYRPESALHTTAIVLGLLVVEGVIGVFLLVGGLNGLAEQMSATGVGVESFVLSLLVFVLFSLLCIGLFIRRDPLQVLERLGLGVLQPHAISMGLLAGLGLFVLQVLVVIVWRSQVPADQYLEQTSAANEIFTSIQISLGAAFLMALATSIGEELFFRGVLQPIFGNVVVSIFFALLHAQYLWTPAMFLIGVVSLCFGWLRSRYGTHAAIVAHFSYNLIPFLILALI